MEADVVAAEGLQFPERPIWAADGSVLVIRLVKAGMGPDHRLNSDA